MHFSATRIFLILALPFGLLFALVTPPFQVPDEINHFLRAYQISLGQIWGTREGDKSGGILPSSLSEVARLVSQNAQGAPHQKISLRTVAQGLHIPLNSLNHSMINFPNTVLYSPAGYGPQALACWVGRSLKGSALLIFYFARLLTLAFSLAVTAYALAKMPRGGWIVAINSLLPMSVFERSSLACDSVLGAFSALGLSLAVQMSDSGVTRARLWGFWVTVGLVSLTKQSYFFFPLLFFLTRQTTGQYLFRFVLPFTILLLMLTTWTISLREIALPQTPGADPLLQLHTLLANPYLFRVLIFHGEFSDTIRELVGVLGWLDTPLPNYLNWTGWILLLLTILVSDYRPTPRQRTVLIGTAVLGYLVIVLLVYLTGAKVGTSSIDGLQGRYFLPYLPILLMALSIPGAAGPWIRRVCAFVLPTVLFISLLVIIKRYYLVCDSLTSCRFY